MARKSIIEVGVHYNHRTFDAFIRSFPGIKAGVMSGIGARVRLLLYNKFLSGQELNLRQYPFDSIGRYTTGSHVYNRGNSVVITSYPANLFEFGRKFKRGHRKGQKEPGRFIIQSKLASAASSRLQIYADQASRSILDKAAKKV